MEFSKEIMNDVFTKYHILGLPFDAVIHHFSAKDEKDHIHDHPFSFTTHILKGGYIEKIYYPKKDFSGYDVEYIIHEVGTSHFVKADSIHEIMEVTEGGCWTLILPQKGDGRKSRFWKFDETGIYSRAWDELEFKLHKNE